MSKMDEVQAERFRFLQALYDQTQGDPLKVVGLYELGSRLGFDRLEAQRIFGYLSGERLVQDRDINDGIGITHAGVKAVERAHAAPESATRYFPPISIINVGRMERSQIQQGAIESTQSGEWGVDENAIRSFIADLKATQSQLGLGPDALSQLNAEVATVEAQVSSPKPTPATIKTSIGSIVRILENAAGSAIAQQLLQRMQGLLP